MSLPLRGGMVTIAFGRTDVFAQISDIGQFAVGGILYARFRADTQVCPYAGAWSRSRWGDDRDRTHHARFGVASDRAVQFVGARALGYKYPLGDGPWL